MAGPFLLFRSLLIASSEKAFTGKPSALYCPILMLFPGGSEGKESTCNVGDLDLIGNIAGRREWQPTPVFLSRESHGQRGLVSHSPGGLQRVDTTEHIHIRSLASEQRLEVSQHIFVK